MWVAVAPVAAEVVDAEALGDAEELAEGEDVALLDDEAEDDDVPPELCEAVEPLEADDPSLAWFWFCVVWVEMVVELAGGAADEPALRTGAPANRPTTMETQKTATIAAAMPIGLWYFFILSRSNLGRGRPDG